LYNDYTAKPKLLFQQTIWLLQLHDCPSCANSKNAVVVNFLVGGYSEVYSTAVHIQSGWYFISLPLQPLHSFV